MSLLGVWRVKAMTRRERIVFLLEHWVEYQEPASSTGLTASSTEGAGYPRMAPICRHPSVVELMRCVEMLGRLGKAHRAHLVAYYGAPWRIAWVPVRSRSGKTVLERDGRPKLGPERRRVVPPWVEPRLVDRGVDAVTTMFNGEPFIPDELLAEIAA